MKALYYPDWERLEITDLPQPVLCDGEVLVRVSDCGICGSELDTFRSRSHRRTPPLIMGHEFAGFVEYAKNTEKRWPEGCRVLSHALVHCGTCAACSRGDTNLCKRRQVFGMQRPGAFAEYVAVPERVLIPLPENVALNTAVFAEPLANGINAMRQGANARRSRVIVIGAGPIGLMCLIAAKRLYRSTVVMADRIPERLEAARALGADLTVNVLDRSLEDEVRTYWSDEGAEFVVDAVGSYDTKRQTIDLSEPGGAVVWVGLQLDLVQLSSYAITLGQKTVSGTYSGSMQDLHQAVQLLSSEPVDVSWAKRYPIDDGKTAFMDMLQSSGGNIKAILHLDNDRSRR
jgi:threonine dehydrogenase-like Zn-dependent dehydrogenase